MRCSLFFRTEVSAERSARPASQPVSHGIIRRAFLFLTSIAVLGCGGRETTLEELEKGLTTAELVALGTPEPGRVLDIEKPNLKLGFIKLIDCAPLVIAKEKHFFRDEGLNVELEAQSNWRVLLDRVIDGQLDGAQMLAGQPIAASIGYNANSPLITACGLSCNGSAITVSAKVWEQMQGNDRRLAAPQPDHPITADSLRPIVDDLKDNGREFNMAMVFPVSTHNYVLRYWLAAAGINPGFYTANNSIGMAEADVLLSVTPPPQMPDILEKGITLGYCVGEPWNQKALASKTGIPVITSYDIWKNSPEKVYAVTKEWNRRHPNTHIAIVKALIRAAKWLDETNADGQLANRQEAARILSASKYVGAPLGIIESSMVGTFAFREEDVRPLPEFVVFFKNHASYPHYSDCIWLLTQMRRWGQIAESMPASWYAETAVRVYQPSIYRKAAEMLAEEGKLSSDELPAASYDGYRPATSASIDAKHYDAHRPVEYINSFLVGNKDDIAFARQ